MAFDTHSTAWMVRGAVAPVPLDRRTEGKKENISDRHLRKQHPALIVRKIAGLKKKKMNLAVLLLLAAIECN